MKLKQALEAFDQLNSQDPNKVDHMGGKIAKEQLYSQRMYTRLLQFKPDADEALTLAAYSQHIQRWKIPRDTYPMTREGYKQWRQDLALFHAETAASLLIRLDYDPETIAKVRYLLQKKGLKKNEDSQALEDVICLVFIEHYLAEFADKHDGEKLVGIIKKTWLKMSSKGHQAALNIELSRELKALITKAIS
jgi:DNA-directed RNA polymerase subunit F